MLPNLPPDWAKLDPGSQVIVRLARAEAKAMMARGGGGPGHAALVMRGVMLAIADQFGNQRRSRAADKGFDMGLESTIRGVQNAFGQVWMEREERRDAPAS